MDRLAYATHLPAAARNQVEKLRALDAERFNNFRQRTEQQPLEIEQHFIDELLHGRLRDFFSVLLELDATPEERRRWLLEHARRVLGDSYARKLAWSLFRKQKSWHESATFLLSTPTAEDLVKSLNVDADGNSTVGSIDSTGHLDSVAQPPPFATNADTRPPDDITGGLISNAANAQSPVIANNTQPAKPRRRGPPKGYENAMKIAEIVKRVAPNGDWRTHLDDVREALAEAGVKHPKWDGLDWCNQTQDELVKKKIDHALELAGEFASLPRDEQEALLIEIEKKKNRETFS